MQVAHDIRNQYTLGYYPTNTAKDGTFRSVKVDLNSTEGAREIAVRTRTGYYAQKDLQQPTRRRERFHSSDDFLSISRKLTP